MSVTALPDISRLAFLCSYDQYMLLQQQIDILKRGFGLPCVVWWEVANHTE